MTILKNKSPWWWVPTLYFTEGIPYFLVNSISVMLFTKMGVPNDQLAFFTTLLYFPWFLKGLWSPFVDIIRTKRWWIIATQVLLTLLCILLTISLPHPDAQTIATKATEVGVFRFTLILFIIAAFTSATHGYYMLAHNEKSQAAFIGIRSTFYRIASVFAQGVLVFIAGRIEIATGNIPFSWQVTLGITSLFMLLVTLYHTFLLPKSDADHPLITTNTKHIWRELGESFTTFFKKKGCGLAITFMLLYRLSEGFLIKLCQPFLVDARNITYRNGSVLGIDYQQIIGGGLGLNTSAITSVAKMFPDRKLTAVFQPHLYTRTRDLYEEFAAALSLADEVVLLPIYPARELPIEGITEQIIAERVSVPWSIVEREALPKALAGMDTDVVVTFGAGNIDAYCGAVADVIAKKS